VERFSYEALEFVNEQVGLALLLITVLPLFRGTQEIEEDELSDLPHGN
jgi:hypothetical protein